MALTKNEQTEPINITIGRLRIAIEKEYPKERQLDLLEKISSEIIELGIKYPEDILF